MPLDIENSHALVSYDIKASNAKVLQMLRKKYKWVDWHVVTYKGSNRPATGPNNSPRRLFYSSSKTHNVHSFVIPAIAASRAEVLNLIEKKSKWKEVVEFIGSDYTKGVQHIESRVKDHFTLNKQIQSFAILPGEKWIIGHYFKNETKQTTLGVVDITIANVFVTSTHNYVVVASFVQEEYPPKCSESCNSKGQCFRYPYSTLMGCKCNVGYSGEKCDAAVTILKLKSVINLILKQTMKLPTFATIQHAIEDTQLYLKTSTGNIQKSITKTWGKN